VQIGVAATSTPIDGVDLNLIATTNLLESAGLIAHAVLHVDNESGLVHLARCLGVQSCVLFGPTPMSYFAYPENVNMVPPECGGCWWVNQTWMDQCPRGMKEPACMRHDPAIVANAIIAAVEAPPDWVRARGLSTTGLQDWQAVQAVRDADQGDVEWKHARASVTRPDQLDGRTAPTRTGVT
jgi:hypothetical protein